MPYVLKVVVAGEGGVGKTALCMRFTKGVFLEGTKMTIGVDFSAVKVKATTKYGEDELVTLQIWDFGGEERFRFILPGYCNGANGAILAYDITQQYTFNNLPEWIGLIRQAVPNIKMILVGLKADLTADRVVPRDVAEAKVQEWGIHGYIEASAKTGDNVPHIFGLITQEMLSIYFEQ
jgi:small GTP-binding protein